MTDEKGPTMADERDRMDDTGEDVRAGAATGARRGSSTVARVAIGVIATCVIAFCVWAMSCYVRGEDPLSFLSGDAFQTTAATTVADASTDATPASTARDVTAADVTDALTSLSFDGADVSVSADQVCVVVGEDGIWVEQVSADDDAIMVDSSARRAWALASWVHDSCPDVSSVTWVVEDASATVRMATVTPTGSPLTSGAPEELLSAMTSYRISGDAYAGLGTSTSVAQRSGDAPTLPDGSEVPVEDGVTSSGEVLDATVTLSGSRVISSSASSGSSASGSLSSDQGPSSQGSSNQGSSDEGSSGSQRQVTVSVTVDGSAAGAGSSSARVSLSSGSTVYDALLAAGANVNASSTPYGIYVSAIGGLAEKEHGGMSGWVYAVNGSEPGVSCSSYVLSEGDSVVWSYVNVED